MTRLEAKAAGITALWVVGIVSGVVVIGFYPICILWVCVAGLLSLIALAIFATYHSIKETLERKARH